MVQRDAEEHLEAGRGHLELAHALAEAAVLVESVEDALVRDEADPGLAQGVEDVPAVAELAGADDLGLVLVQEADALLVLGVLGPVDDLPPLDPLARRLAGRPVVVERELFRVVVLVRAGRGQREDEERQESFHVTSSGFRGGREAWGSGGPS